MSSGRATTKFTAKTIQPVVVRLRQAAGSPAFWRHATTEMIALGMPMIPVAMSEITETISRTKVLTGNGDVCAGTYPAYAGCRGACPCRGGYVEAYPGW